MKYKFLFLLPVLALALAAGFTNCAKDTESTTATSVDQSATERGNCLVRVTVNGNATLCGTQTNTNFCGLVPGQTWATSPGVENVTAGTTGYLLATPCDFSVTNNGAGVMTVQIMTSVITINDQIAAGATAAYHITDLCGVIKIQ